MAPALPALPAPGVGDGEGDVGEEGLQVLHAPDHLPVLLGPGPGLVRGPLLDLLPPQGDPPVLVDRELGEVAGLPGQPDLVEEGGPGLGELEGEAGAALLEVVPGAAAVELPGEHPGGEVLPAAARPPVAHRQQPGVRLVRQAVAGRHIARLDVGAAGLLGEAAAHVGNALRHTIGGGLGGARGMDYDIALHAPLPGFVVVEYQLAVLLLEPVVLLLHLHQLLLQVVHFLGELCHGSLHLGLDGILQVGGHLGPRVEDLLLYLLQLGSLGQDDLLEDVDGDALVPDLLLQALVGLGQELQLLLADVPVGSPELVGGLHLGLVHLAEADLQVVEVLLYLTDDGGGVGDLLEVLEEVLLAVLRGALQLLEQGGLLLLVVEGLLQDELDGVEGGGHGDGELGACLFCYFTCIVQALWFESRICLSRMTSAGISRIS